MSCDDFKADNAKIAPSKCLSTLSVISLPFFKVASQTQAASNMLPPNYVLRQSICT